MLIIRLIKEDTYKIYYSTENSKEYHEYEPQFIEVDEKFVPGIKQIITSYPTFISVKELLIEDDNDKVIKLFAINLKYSVYDVNLCLM